VATGCDAFGVGKFGFGGASERLNSFLTSNEQRSYLSAIPGQTRIAQISDLRPSGPTGAKSKLAKHVSDIHD